MKNLLLVSVLMFGACISGSAFAQTSPIVQEIGQARLDLAAALIKALDSNLVCDADAYPTEINRLVSAATMQLDATEVATWANAMPATSKMHGDFAFRQTVNPVRLEDKMVSVADIEQQLVGTTFHAFGAGVDGSQHKVIFGKAGSAVVKNLEILEKAPYTKWTNTTATWKVVVLKTPSGEEATLQIGTTTYQFQTQTGEIWLVPTNVPADKVQSETLTTTDSYCEA